MYIQLVTFKARHLVTLDKFKFYVFKILFLSLMNMKCFDQNKICNKLSYEVFPQFCQKLNVIMTLKPLLTKTSNNIIVLSLVYALQHLVRLIIAHFKSPGNIYLCFTYTS